MDCSLCDVPSYRTLVSSWASFCIAASDPLQPGHLVVAPIRHVHRLADLPPDELIDLMSAVARVVVAAEIVKSPDRYYVLHIGDKTPHYHFHLVPRSATAPSLGPFIFGPDGWRQELSRTSPGDQQAVCESIKDLLTRPSR